MNKHHSLESNPILRILSQETKCTTVLGKAVLSARAAGDVTEWLPLHSRSNDNELSADAAELSRALSRALPSCKLSDERKRKLKRSSAFTSHACAPNGFQLREG